MLVELINSDPRQGRTTTVDLPVTAANIAYALQRRGVKFYVDRVEYGYDLSAEINGNIIARKTVSVIEESVMDSVISEAARNYK